MVSCQHCDEDLGTFPEDDVEDGRRDEVVAHKYDPEGSIAISETAHYCDPDCFVAAHGGDA